MINNNKKNKEGSVCSSDADNDDNGSVIVCVYIYMLSMILTIDDTYDIRRRDTSIC